MVSPRRAGRRMSGAVSGAAVACISKILFRFGCADYCTLGWAPTPIVSAEGRRRTLKAIHAPPIVSSTAPAGTVGGVAWAPIVSAYARPKTYIKTGANAHSAPAHLGRIPERQTATPQSALPTNCSSTDTPKVAVCALPARLVGSLRYSSMPAKYACPSTGVAKVETPP